MSEGKFWLLFWSIIGAVIIAIGVLIVYAGYLDDERDLAMASKGLQKYKVERCSSISIKNEWHEAGWKNKDVQ